MFENKTYTTFFFQVVCLVYYTVCCATSQYFHRKLQNIPANSSATVKFWKNSKKHRNLLSFFDNFSLFRTAHTTFCPFFCTFYFIRLSSSFICKSKHLKFFVSAISFRRLFRQSPSQNKKHSRSGRLRAVRFGFIGFNRGPRAYVGLHSLRYLKGNGSTVQALARTKSTSSRGRYFSKCGAPPVAVTFRMRQARASE